MGPVLAVLLVKEALLATLTKASFQLVMVDLEFGSGMENFRTVLGISPLEGLVLCDFHSFGCHSQILKMNLRIESTSGVTVDGGY